MKNSKEFPFERARRVTKGEVKAAKKAIEEKTGQKRPGRPKKAEPEKFKPVSIRLHPKVIVWAKKEAKKRGVGYQTIINEVLLKKAG
jgi:uncharacterized protein (DUF4415 family)